MLVFNPLTPPARTGTPLRKVSTGPTDQDRRPDVVQGQPLCQNVGRMLVVAGGSRHCSGSCGKFCHTRWLDWG